MNTQNQFPTGNPISRETMKKLPSFLLLLLALASPATRAAPKYVVTVFTADQENAQTDGNVSIVLYGENGATHEMVLDKPDHNDLERGQTDQYTDSGWGGDSDFGRITGIKLTNPDNDTWTVKMVYAHGPSDPKYPDWKKEIINPAWGPFDAYRFDPSLPDPDDGGKVKPLGVGGVKPPTAYVGLDEQGQAALFKVRPDIKLNWTRDQSPKWLFIHHFKCINPAEGMGATASTILGQLLGFTAQAGVLMIPYVGEHTHDALDVFVTSGDNNTWGDAGESITKQIVTATSQTDHFYFKIQDKDVYTGDDGALTKGLGQNDVKVADYAIRLDREVKLELMEWDVLENDWLGGFFFNPNMPVTTKAGGETILIEKKADKSVYEINYFIVDAPPAGSVPTLHYDYNTSKVSLISPAAQKLDRDRPIQQGDGISLRSLNSSGDNYLGGSVGLYVKMRNEQNKQMYTINGAGGDLVDKATYKIKAGSLWLYETAIGNAGFYGSYTGATYDWRLHKVVKECSNKDDRIRDGDVVQFSNGFYAKDYLCDYQNGYAAAGTYNKPNKWVIQTMGIRSAPAAGSMPTPPLAQGLAVAAPLPSAAPAPAAAAAKDARIEKGASFSLKLLNSDNFLGKNVDEYVSIGKMEPYVFEGAQGNLVENNKLYRLRSVNHGYVFETGKGNVCFGTQWTVKKAEWKLEKVKEECANKDNWIRDGDVVKLSNGWWDDNYLCDYQKGLAAAGTYDKPNKWVIQTTPAAAPAPAKSAVDAANDFSNDRVEEGDRFNLRIAHFGKGLGPNDGDYVSMAGYPEDWEPYYFEGKKGNLIKNEKLYKLKSGPNFVYETNKGDAGFWPTYTGKEAEWKLEKVKEMCVIKDDSIRYGDVVKLSNGHWVDNYLCDYGEGFAAAGTYDKPNIWVILKPK